MPFWPAPPATLDAALGFLDGALARGRVLLLCDRDLDGLAAAALLHAAFERRGALVSVAVAGQGGASLAAQAGAPALRAPRAAVCLALLRGWSNVDDLAWLAALPGLGGMVDSSFTPVNGGSSSSPSRHLAEAAALLNVATRAPAFDPALAVRVLARSPSPAALVDPGVPGVDELLAWRAEVNHEVARCSRSKPRFAGRVALVRFSSPARIQAVVAGRWIRRLKRMIVVAANDGLRPGRVGFAVRSSDVRLDLGALLRGLPLEELDEAISAGQPRAGGGELSSRDFERLLVALGFAAATPDLPLPRSRSSSGRTPARPEKRRTASCKPRRTGSSP